VSKLPNQRAQSVRPMIVSLLILWLFTGGLRQRPKVVREVSSLYCESPGLEIGFQPIVRGVVVGELLFFVLELPGMPVFEVEVGRRGKLGV